MTPPRNAFEEPGTSVSAAATSPPVSDSAAATVSPARVSSPMISVASSRAAGPATPSVIPRPPQQEAASAQSQRSFGRDRSGAQSPLKLGRPATALAFRQHRAGINLVQSPTQLQPAQDGPDTIAVLAIRPGVRGGREVRAIGVRAAARGHRATPGGSLLLVAWGLAPTYRAYYVVRSR